MSKKLPVILILGGVVIAAIAFFGNQYANTPSDVELLQEAMLDKQAAERATEAGLAEQRKKVLTVPTICEATKTRTFFEICGYEPDPGQTPPPWNKGLSHDEQNCILEALHATNLHAFQLKQKEYVPEEPSDMDVINFACDVAGATIFDSNITYGDADASAPKLLTAFYRERASTRFGPEKWY